MTTHTQSLAARVQALPTLPMKELWQLWDRFFPRRPSHHNRNYIEGRVAYKLQEEALGGIDPRVRKQLIKIGEDQSKIPGRNAGEIRIVPGTVMVREYNNREHRVTALADGLFEIEGKTFKSLSAAARSIVGCQVSGPVFFGLKQSARK